MGRRVLPRSWRVDPVKYDELEDYDDIERLRESFSLYRHRWYFESRYPDPDHPDDRREDIIHQGILCFTPHKDDDMGGLLVRLIEASPKMFHACKAILRLEQMIDDTGISRDEWWTMKRRAYEDLKQAIAKIE